MGKKVGMLEHWFSLSHSGKRLCQIDQSHEIIALHRVMQLCPNPNSSQKLAFWQISEAVGSFSVFCFGRA